MLRDIHAYVGSIGTLLATVGMLVVFLGWWMAITATVVRQGVGTWVKAIRIVMIAVFPPLGVLFLLLYVRSDRAVVSQAMRSASLPGHPERSSDSSGVDLVLVQAA